MVRNHPVHLVSTPQEGQGIARQITSPCLLQSCSCSPPSPSQPGTKTSAQASHSCIHTAHNHPVPCKGIIRQSLARDWRFVTSIICISWRRAGPRLLWEKPSSLLRVPQLMEGLIDLLITIMLFFSIARKKWPPWNAAFVSAETNMAQILQHRATVSGLATPLLVKECASAPFPACCAEPFTMGTSDEYRLLPLLSGQPNPRQICYRFTCRVTWFLGPVRKKITLLSSK